MHYILNIIYLNILTLQIEFRDIRNFLLGLLTGFILLFLFIVFMFATGKRKKTHIRLMTTIPLDDNAVYDMIVQKQNLLSETVRLTDNAYFKVAFDLSLELAQEIARYYYPKSKYPLYELSIQELLDLNYYITKRIEEIINGKLIRHFKNNRIVTIVNILNTKKAIDNSKLMKLSRKYKFSKLYTVGRAVLNYANPIFWFRKLAIKPSTVLVTKEICKYIITIFGEETNKIYSKTIFKKDESEEEVIAKIDKLIETEEEE